MTVRNRLAAFHNGEISREDLLRPIPQCDRKRRTLPTSTRWRIMKRDNHRCTLCGATAGDVNVRLHIDHIMPFSKGGTDDDENLRVLCQDCNSGKRDELPEKSATDKRG